MTVNSKDRVVISLASCILPRQNPNPPITSSGTPTTLFNPKSLFIHLLVIFFTWNSSLSFSSHAQLQLHVPPQTITFSPAMAQPPKDEG
nr:xyloglucan galactosyltransferase XLT2-like [Ipomoea batatas]